MLNDLGYVLIEILYGKMFLRSWGIINNVDLLYFVFRKVIIICWNVEDCDKLLLMGFYLMKYDI